MIENFQFKLTKQCIGDDYIFTKKGKLKQLEVFLPDPIVEFIENYCTAGDDVFILSYTMDICEITITKLTQD